MIKRNNAAMFHEAQIVLAVLYGLGIYILPLHTQHISKGRMQRINYVQTLESDLLQFGWSDFEPRNWGTPLLNAGKSQKGSPLNDCNGSTVLTMPSAAVINTTNPHMLLVREKIMAEHSGRTPCKHLARYFPRIIKGHGVESLDLDSDLFGRESPKTSPSEHLDISSPCTHFTQLKLLAYTQIFYSQCFSGPQQGSKAYTVHS